MLGFHNDNVLDNVHILDITERKMSLISRVIPSALCVVFLLASLLSLSKLANAGGYSFSLWGAGFNIPGNPMCAFRPELCLPDYPGSNGTQKNIPRVIGGN